MKRTITTIILAFGVTWAWAQNINANKYLATDSVDFSIQGITDNRWIVLCSGRRNHPLME